MCALCVEMHCVCYCVLLETVCVARWRDAGVGWNPDKETKSRGGNSTAGVDLENIDFWACGKVFSSQTASIQPVLQEN